MKTTPSQRIALVATALVLIVAGWTISASPARDRIIDSTQVWEVNGEFVLEVNFSLPFRYHSHFPLEAGDELRIRITPVRIPVSDLGAVFRHEGLVPPDADAAAIDEVVYEGDAAGGPYLTVRFTRPMHYQVVPGGDYRSLSIVIQKLAVDSKQ